MAGLLSTNADSVRDSSILWKIHTDQRSSSKPSTIASLMTIKFNSEEYDTLCQLSLSIDYCFVILSTSSASVVLSVCMSR